MTCREEEKRLEKYQRENAQEGSSQDLVSLWLCCDFIKDGPSPES